MVSFRSFRFAGFFSPLRVLAHAISHGASTNAVRMKSSSKSLGRCKCKIISAKLTSSLWKSNAIPSSCAKSTAATLMSKMDVGKQWLVFIKRTHLDKPRWGDSFNYSEPVLNHLLNLPEARDTMAAKSVNEANMTNERGQTKWRNFCQVRCM